MRRPTLLKLFRMNAGLTQLELARLLGVKEWLVVRWETGRTDPNDAMQRRIADVLHIEPEVLAK